jgi:hypothetical protein
MGQQFSRGIDRHDGILIVSDRELAMVDALSARPTRGEALTIS